MPPWFEFAAARGNGSLPAIVLLVCLLASGCAENGSWNIAGQSRRRTPLASPDDVFRVVCTYQPPYWKNYSPEKSDRVEGFKFNLYLVSRRTGRGIHTEGMLHTRMFVRQELPDGSIERTEVCAWSQPLQDTPRTAREFALGWAYQPLYYWGEIEVAGEEVEIVVWYESPTGRKVYAQPQFLKVPAARFARDTGVNS